MPTVSLDTPPIRFLRRRDGQRIAYAVHGEGPPLVCPAWWVSHLEEDWKDESFREFFSGLAEHHTVVRYDRLGSGLSDRERQSVDLASEVEMLAELVDHLELDSFAMFALSCAGPPALAYTATHPARVSALVLFGSFARGSDVGPPELKDAMQGLVRAHWGIGSRTLTDLFAPDLGTEEMRRLSRGHQKAASGEMAAQLLALTFDVDVEQAATTIETRTLVLHRADDRAIRHRAGRELAAMLPNASFVTLDGGAHVPWLGDREAAVLAVLRFLGHEPRTREVAPAETGNVLQRSGDVWTLVFAGRSASMKHARGLVDLALLLTSSGRDVHVAELYSGPDHAESLAVGADDVLDEDAVQSYRERLRAIEAEIEEAEQRHDAARASRLDAEREALAKELRGAAGLGGRKRRLAEPSERARKAVTARIRATIKKILEVHPELGLHLQGAVMTGNYCTYDPQPPVIWRFDDDR